MLTSCILFLVVLTAAETILSAEISVQSLNSLVASIDEEQVANEYDPKRNDVEDPSSWAGVTRWLEAFRLANKPAVTTDSPARPVLKEDYIRRRRNSENATTLVRRKRTYDNCMICSMMPNMIMSFMQECASGGGGCGQIMQMVQSAMQPCGHPMAPCGAPPPPPQPAPCPQSSGKRKKGKK